MTFFNQLDGQESRRILNFSRPRNAMLHTRDERVEALTLQRSNVAAFDNLSRHAEGFLRTQKRYI